MYFNFSVSSIILSRKGCEYAYSFHRREIIDDVGQDGHFKMKTIRTLKPSRATRMVNRVMTKCWVRKIEEIKRERAEKLVTYNNGLTYTYNLEVSFSKLKSFLRHSTPPCGCRNNSGLPLNSAKKNNSI